MGWSYFNDTNIKKKELIAYLISQERLGKQFTVLKHAVVGNHLWTVVERNEPGNMPVRFIGLDLMAPGGKDSGWGYNDLCERQGLLEIDCPVSFFDMVPPPESEASEGWRDAVRQHHEAKRKAAKLATLGTTIAIGDDLYRLERDLGRRGWLVSRVSDNRAFRAKARDVAAGLRQLAANLPPTEASSDATEAVVPEQMTLAA